MQTLTVPCITLAQRQGGGIINTVAPGIRPAWVVLAKSFPHFGDCVCGLCLVFSSVNETVSLATLGLGNAASEDSNPSTSLMALEVGRRGPSY